MTTRLALVLAAVVVLAGCRQREITSLERKEAANVLSEAEFAITMKDWSRAEGLYAHATELCPDQGEAWVGLGVVRMRLHNSSGAKSAYKSGLAVYQDEIKQHPENTTPVVRCASVLVILGRPDEARSLVEKAYEKNPGDRYLKNFIEIKGLDRLIADPGLKEVSP